MAKGKTQDTLRYFASVTVTHELNVALPNANSLESAVEEARKLNAHDLWTGKTPTQDVYDHDITLDGVRVER